MTGQELPLGKKGLYLSLKETSNFSVYSYDTLDVFFPPAEKKHSNLL